MTTNSYTCIQLQIKQSLFKFQLESLTTKKEKREKIEEEKHKARKGDSQKRKPSMDLKQLKIPDFYQELLHSFLKPDFWTQMWMIR